MTETILEEAQRLVHSDRAGTYGHPLDNHGCTAAMADPYLLRKHGPTRGPLDAEDIAIINILQKISREANVPKRDNRTDGAGYFENVQMIADERERRAHQTVTVMRPAHCEQCRSSFSYDPTWRGERRGCPYCGSIAWAVQG